MTGLNGAFGSERGHSAAVRIELHIAGQRMRVGQVGGGRMIFDECVIVPAGTGELVMWVDGDERRWRIEVPPQAGASRVVTGELFEVG